MFMVVDSVGRFLGFIVGAFDADGVWTTDVDRAWRGERWAADALAKDSGGTVVPVRERANPRG